MNRKFIKNIVVAIVCLALVLSLCACGGAETPETVAPTQVETKAIDELWTTALYTQDTKLGDGATSITVEVQAGEHSVAFELNTDKAVLADAMAEFDLVSGEESEYGLYIKEVNGIVADYDADKAYWALYQGDEYSMAGADSVKVTNGSTYTFVYTK